MVSSTSASDAKSLLRNPSQPLRVKAQRSEIKNLETAVAYFGPEIKQMRQEIDSVIKSVERQQKTIEMQEKDIEAIRVTIDKKLQVHFILVQN